MKKIWAKIILFFLILKFIIPMNVIWEVFAANLTVDFESAGWYTVSSGTWNRTTADKFEWSYSIVADNAWVQNSTSCFEISRNSTYVSNISFAYKVSSEANYDYLHFYLDGTEQNKWAWNVAWSQYSKEVPIWNHTFKWCYTKDGSVDGGSDTAWVDVFSAVDVISGTTAILDFETTGWYTVTGWTWNRTTADKHEGAYSIVADNGWAHNSSSCFERSETFGADWDTSFYYKVDSEVNYDYLKFYLDGTEKKKWSWAIAWAEYIQPVLTWTHTFKWCYTKDGSVSGWSDTAWVDFFTKDVIISITEVTPVVTPESDTTPDYTFNTSIAGTISYSWACDVAWNPNSAVAWNNTITFWTLPYWTYTDCKIQVSDWTNTTLWLDVSNFTIELLSSAWKIFHFDAQNVDWDGNSANQPANWTSVWTWVDIKNAYNSTQATWANQAKFQTSAINNLPSIRFDWVDDFYDIANQADINTAASYNTKSFAMVLKTGADVTTFQNIYEQWGWSRWYALQIDNGHFYMWAWNNSEWDAWNQYKFVDLWVINPNEVYEVLISQDSTSGADATNTIKAYIDWSLAGTLTHVDIQKAHAWNNVFWKNTDGRKYDATSPWDGHFFKWDIWEFISYNAAIDGTTRTDLDAYFTARWNLDKVSPTITSTSFSWGTILPGWNHNVVFNYNDGAWVWVDASSDFVFLYKWNGTAWWSDIAATGLNLWSKVVTTSSATYSTNDLAYWKYRLTFWINDVNGNNVTQTLDFYIDKPEFIISAPTIDIWSINNISSSFSPEVTITVKTIWAWFRVLLNKDTNLAYWVESITSWDWTKGFWYDKEVYTWNINTINADENIATQVSNVNTNWNLNTYTYKVKLGALNDAMQMAWEYEGNISFGIKLDY